MKVVRTKRVKLYPTKAQEEELLRILAACRFTWNYFLDLKKNHYLEHKKNLSYLKLSKLLTQLRKTAPELQGIQSRPLQQTLRRLDKAYNAFFRKQSKFPNYKVDARRKLSFERVNDWRVIGNRIKIQKGLEVRFRGELGTTGGGTLVVSHVAESYWYATAFIKQEIEMPVAIGEPIGIDLGLNALATLNTGEKFQVKKNDLWPKIARLQRRLAKQQPGSNRYRETCIAISRIYHKMANIRQDNTHKTTTKILVGSPSVVAMENLAIPNMVKCRSLAKSIQNAKWGEFKRQIAYKTQERGGELREIDRFFPSSKTCSVCLFVIDKLPLSEREWVCPKCETSHDRDVNAARVILLQGQGMARAES